MYGERPPEADGERREHREDLAPEALGELLALGAGDVVEADDADAVLGQRGAQVMLDAAVQAAGELDHALADLVDRLARRAPVGAARRDAGVDLVVQARDADHEELVEVGRVDRRRTSRARAAARSGSSASWSTRSLKSSHESSRLK